MEGAMKLQKISEIRSLNTEKEHPEESDEVNY